MNKLFVFITLLWCSATWAGSCQTITGSPHVYTYGFGVKNITDPSQDAQGTLFQNAYTWNLGGRFDAICSCSGTYKGVYYTTETTLPLGHNDGSHQFYKINDYIEISSDVYIGGGINDYRPVPLHALWNQDPGTSQCNVNTGKKEFAAGSQGRLSLYISKPFISGSYIINTQVFSLYGTTSATDTFSGNPLSTVYISGTITVPQNCVINSGKIVSVDFGTLYSGDFTTAGEKPRGAIEKTFNVPIKCTNIGAPANLTLRIQGTADAHNTQAIATNNADVGVVVTNESGDVLTPNNSSSVIGFVTDTTGNGNVTLKAYPVSTTGNTPAEGVFTALAYLRIDFA